MKISRTPIAVSSPRRRHFTSLTLKRPLGYGSGVDSTARGYSGTKIWEWIRRRLSIRENVGDLAALGSTVGVARNIDSSPYQKPA